MRKLFISMWLRALLLFSLICEGAFGADTLASKRVASGIQRPVFCGAPAGDTRRLFIVEQHTGNIRILDLASGNMLPTPLVTVENLTKDNEQGLLGLAFHPQFAKNGLFFINCTLPKGGGGGHTEIVRYKMKGDPLTTDVADPASRTTILSFDQPEANHNGGWIDFGPDAFLYIGSGDGGGGDDRHGTIGNGQALNTLLGKILRIDVNTEPYAIPAGNPLKADKDKKAEIWAFGIRNPWRCSFDRATGHLWIGDVGQNKREEVDVIPKGVAGLNFGWRPREGITQNPSFGNEKTVTPATPPIFDYTRERGNCIIGGYVYRGKAIPSLQGTYIFGDNGSSRIWSFTFDGMKVSNEMERTGELNPGAGKQRPIGNITSFGEDAAGELYICDMGNGAVHKIVPAGDTAVKPVAEAGTASTSKSIATPYLKMPKVPENVPALLSQTGSFENLAQLSAPALISYTVNEAFWSDGAIKRRWMALPAGQTISFSAKGEWTFPAGTVFVKHFDLNLDERKPEQRRRLETRLLIVGEGGKGYGVTYRWKEDGSDAELLADSRTDTLTITTAAGATRTQKWYYPSRTDCLVCHTVNAGLVLGVNTRQLNCDFGTPTASNQLRSWNQLGLFKPALKDADVAGLDRLVKTRDAGVLLESRVRTYLDVNCAYCHRPGGAQGNLDARFDSPEGFKKLIGGNVNINLDTPGTKIVAPGDVEHSAVLKRIQLVGKNQMPPVGRNEVDAKGVELLEEWIKALPLK